MLMRIMGILLILSIFSCSNQTGPAKILVFSKTEGFRHESISSGIAAIQKMGTENAFEVVTTEDAAVFIQSELEQYDAVVFMNTTGDVLDNAQQHEFQRYMQAGGGFVGVHSAADTEYEWPWFGKMVGAYFNGHPNNPNVRDANVQVLNTTHESCKHLKNEDWPRTDEWYNYKSINPDINVLLNLDESSYEGGTNGENHPIAWYHEYDGGRAFYTGGGHTHEAFAEPDFYQHLLGGITYAIGNGKGPNYALSSVAPEENRFTKNILDQGLDEPMELVLLPNDKILFIERKGAIKLYEPELKATKVIHKLNVHTEFEDGLLGVALDPNFEKNNWIYLCYSPAGDESKQHVSRFDFKNDELDLDSEKILLEVPVQRVECCHSAGAMEFGPKGNLFVSFGDNTNPHFSDGYSPSDEKPNRGPFDAQKSSSNMNDLRGGIIRITPQDDGSYSIPDGNLFAKDGSEGRPEIYVKGCRNPYRFSIDPKTYYLYWGDVGPDASKDSLERGPMGYDEVNQARGPGYFGWPYFIADNKPYYRYDFAKKVSIEEFDPKKPINTSPNNTGVNELPPAQPAFIWYPYGKSDVFPLVGDGSRNAMAGPVYYHEDYAKNENAFPAYYDKKLFTYDWMRGWFMAITMNEEGDFVNMERFMPSSKFSNPTDVLLSPEGDFYMLEYGTNWFSQNEDARLVHLTYAAGNRKPAALIETDKTIGAAPLTVAFSSKKASDPDGDALKTEWSFTGDKVQSTEKNPKFTFENPGFYQVKLKVTDVDGLEAEHVIPISVGNDLPEVAIDFKGNKTFYWDSAKPTFSVSVSDKEDGTLGAGIDASDVIVSLDYLKEGVDKNEIAIGHASMMELGLQGQGKKLMEKSDCYTCHKEYDKSIGPTHFDVSKKYKGDKNAVNYLVDRIINGGGGVWGETPMAAHPDMPKADAEKMVKYILAMTAKDAKKDVKNIGTSGSLVFNKHNKKNQEGSYLLTATYQDKGTKEAPALTARDAIVLRSASFPAVNFDETEKAMKFKVEPGMVPGMTEELELVVGMKDSYVLYKDIDLTGVDALNVVAGLIPEFSQGGKLEIRIDEPNGTLIGEKDMQMIPANFGMKPHQLDLVDTKGSHDLYIKFKNDELDNAMVCTLVNLSFIPKQGVIN